MAGSATPTNSAGHATPGAPADPELTLVPDHSSGADQEQQVKIVAQLDALQSKLDSVKALQNESAAELDAMLPAILDKAFKGEL